jgi:hypothetical protein
MKTIKADIPRLKRLGPTVVINDEQEASQAVVDAAITLQGA